jgi:hypothetical protein
VFLNGITGFLAASTAAIFVMLFLGCPIRVPDLENVKESSVCKQPRGAATFPFGWRLLWV